MKPASSAFLSFLEDETTTVCTIWRLTPQGRDTLYLTDHDTPITIDGQTYESVRTSFVMSAIDNSVGSANVNFEIDVLLGDLIDRTDVEKGIYSGATIEIETANYMHLDAGTMPQATGEVTSITLPLRFVAKFSCVGRTTASRHLLTEVYTATCRAEFCDERCSLNIADYTFGPYTVASVTNSLKFGASYGNPADNLYNLGHVTWLTGANAGRVSDIQISTGTTVQLLIRPPYQMEVGDTFTISRGCAKTLEACVSYNNKLNFRGEPYTPGQDFIATPTQQELTGDPATEPDLTPFGPDWDWRDFAL
jgi:uncharacterized phage protein (TIGR02218 family)